MKTGISGSTSIVINSPVTKVWESLTRPEIIKKYFFGTNTHTDWVPGNPIRFEGEWEGKKYEDKGTILKNKHLQQLQYNYWSSMSGIEDKPENYVIITYKLEEIDSSHTKLTVIQENIPDKKMRDHSIENWNKVLESLKQLLEKEVVL
jgi:uncharacterized protein YndB with AHSA1/START domain